MAVQIINIMIVDDHPLVRSGLRQLIETELDLRVCCEAASMVEAQQVFSNHSPDLAIIDLSLPDGSGLDLIKHILARQPDMKTLVSSMYDEDLFAVRALRAGARGYINKQEAGEQVIAAIRQVLTGELYLSSRMTEHLIVNTAHSTDDQKYSPAQTLSNRELEVFELTGHGLTTSDIAERLHLSVKTIESHRANIKTKLRLNSAGELIRCAVQWTLDT